MSTRSRFVVRGRAWTLSLALALPAVLAAETAAADDSYFFGLVRRTPMVHVQIAGSASYAQLIQQLQSRGYADIKVTPLSPNLLDPRPEIMHPDLTFSSPNDKEARETPIHRGWNGTAVKNGEKFEVYVDHESGQGT